MLPFLLVLASPIEDYAQAIQQAPIRPAVDEKDSFRGLTFGATCSREPSLHATGSRGDLVRHERSGDKLEVGSAQLEWVHYLCHEDRFVLAHLRAPEDQAGPLLLALVAVYGKPSIEEASLAYWRGKDRGAWAMLHEGRIVVAIGDYPWGDPVGLALGVIKEEAKDGAQDL